MAIRYYWDRELFDALLRYRMRPFLADIIGAYEKTMATAADIQKLIDGMKRAQVLTDRAAESAPRNAAIMDAFEHRLNLNDENVGKIAEYEKQMAAMETGSNGGPALVTTFSSDAKSPAAVAADTVTPVPAAAPFDHATGDVLK